MMDFVVDSLVFRLVECAVPIDCHPLGHRGDLVAVGLLATLGVLDSMSKFDR